MGKVEDMRRLREQRAEQLRRAPVPAAPRPKAAAPAPAAAAPAAAAPAAAPTAGVEGERCGHTSISGRSCTREKDHQKTGTKNHRYG